MAGGIAHLQQQRRRPQRPLPAQSTPEIAWQSFWHHFKQIFGRKTVLHLPKMNDIALMRPAVGTACKCAPHLSDTTFCWCKGGSDRTCKLRVGMVMTTNTYTTCHRHQVKFFKVTRSTAATCGHTAANGNVYNSSWKPCNNEIRSIFPAS